MIWTDEMRKKMFSRLLNEFGPHRNWNATRSPRGKRKEYQLVLSELAAEFSKQTKREIKSTAVQNQIDWGITLQKTMKDQSHVRNFILNKAAALEVGFISFADLPRFMDVKKDDV